MYMFPCYLLGNCAAQKSTLRSRVWQRSEGQTDTDRVAFAIGKCVVAEYLVELSTAHTFVNL